MDTLLEHLDNRVDLRVRATVRLHRQHNQICLLEAIRCTLVDLRRPNHSAPECCPEHIDPGVGGTVVTPGRENRRDTKCVGHDRAGGNDEYRTR
jgi:hypothetical protein